MSKALDLPDRSMRLAAGAKAAMLAVTRGLNALLVEHSRALLAATNAASPRRRLADLRAMYTADRLPDGGYR